MPDRVPSEDQAARSGRSLGAWVFAFLSIVSIVVAGGGAAFVAQLNSLKAELASVRREFAAAKDKVDRLERQINEALAANRLQMRPDRVGDGASRITEDAGSRSLELSREEIQLLRDYIKVPPAPPGVTSTITVGAAVATGMLMPLPSQITDKVPRLTGASFMTDRNGAIVIVRRGSRQADAVINPN